MSQSSDPSHSLGEHFFHPQEFLSCGFLLLEEPVDLDLLAGSLSLNIIFIKRLFIKAYCFPIRVLLAIRFLRKNDALETLFESSHRQIVFLPFQALLS